MEVVDTGSTLKIDANYYDAFTMIDALRYYAKHTGDEYAERLAKEIRYPKEV